MTHDRDRAIHLLRAWQEKMQECDAQMDLLSTLIGTSPESPLQSAVYAVMGECTMCVADLIGCSDEWLEAWWLDHNFGAIPMHAGLTGEPMREITTLEQMADLIVDDLSMAAREGAE